MTDVSAKNDGWEPDILVERPAPSREERLQQIREKRFSGRSDDEADIDFLLEVIDGTQGEMVELSGALELSERKMTAMRAELSEVQAKLRRLRTPGGQP